MKLICLLLASFLFLPSAFAADGSSGCGPGWYVFKDNSLVSSALRSTTNGIFFPTVTFGMTFGTSKCTKHKIVKHEKRSLHFATNSYFDLQADVARGQGEHLDAFVSTLGCQSSAKDLATQEFKSHYGQIFPDQQIDPERALLEVYKVIFSNKQLTQKCSLQAIG